jgi:glycerophosphoryl diester phosphodiesterase
MFRSKVWRIAAGIVLALIIVYVIGALIAKPAPASIWPDEEGHRPLVIAHQGGEGLRPSSTMEAYQHAVDLGADVLEGDIHITSDGHLVLIHDEEVDRTTNQTGLVSEMTLAQIKLLDAGYYWTDDDGATFPYRGKGLQIVTLEELFTTFPQKAYVIEIKKSAIPTEQPLCDLIRAYDMQDKVMVASFYDDRMAIFRATCPEVTTSSPKGETTVFFAMNTLFLNPLYTPKATALEVPEYQTVSGVNLHVLTPAFVRGAHARGMGVHPWTINETADLQRMIALGVDGIITDRPDRLLDLLQNP